MSAYFREHPTPRALPWMKHSREIYFFHFFPVIPSRYLSNIMEKIENKKQGILKN
jgi:hypothetical protein